jgi:histidinol-phosphate aminotransferase
MTFDVQSLARKNIRDLKPYSSARSEFSGSAQVFLDANENPYGSPAGDGFNRYPDPLQTELKQRIAEMKSVKPSQIFVGNGSDEAIDLLFRIFCEPGCDRVLICPPTYGMYKVSAAINDVHVLRVNLTDEFQLDVNAVSAAFSPLTKILFICSPNNPTGNSMDRTAVLELARNFSGIVVVDEAYIDYAEQPSLIDAIDEHPNLVVLQTFSKAWGMAGLRVGMAFANEEIIELLNSVKPPYNVSSIAQRAVLEATRDRSWVTDHAKETVRERRKLVSALTEFPFVERVHASDANFVLVRTAHPDAVYRYLIENKIIVRNRSNVELCEGCLRITVGTADENILLLDALRSFRQESSAIIRTAGGQMEI